MSARVSLFFRLFIDLPDLKGITMVKSPFLENRLSSSKTQRIGVS